MGKRTERTVSLKEIHGLIEAVKEAGYEVKPDTFKQVEALQKDIETARKELLEKLAQESESAGLSSKVPSGVMFDLLVAQKLTPVERVVLEGILLGISKAGLFYGDTRTLADNCGISQLTILRRLESLQTKGIIVVYSSPRGTLIEINSEILSALSPYLDQEQAP